MNLTAVQRDLLWKVDAWARQNQGQRPSFEELRRYAMVSSTSVVRYNLRRLADLGLVTLVPNTARSVWLTDAGRRECGLKTAAEEDAEMTQIFRDAGFYGPDDEERCANRPADSVLLSDVRFGDIAAQVGKAEEAEKRAALGSAFAPDALVQRHRLARGL